MTGDPCWARKLEWLLRKRATRDLSQSGVVLAFLCRLTAQKCGHACEKHSCLGEAHSHCKSAVYMTGSKGALHRQIKSAAAAQGRAAPWRLRRWQGTVQAGEGCGFGEGVRRVRGKATQHLATRQTTLVRRPPHEAEHGYHLT